MNKILVVVCSCTGTSRKVAGLPGDAEGGQPAVRPVTLSPQVS